MSCNADLSHSITLADGAELTARYREQMTAGQIKGGFFGKEALMRILEQEGCTGIKYYYGLDASDKQVLVLVGAESTCDDMVEGELAEISLPCPDYCGTPNVLNS